MRGGVHPVHVAERARGAGLRGDRGHVGPGAEDVAGRGHRHQPGPLGQQRVVLRRRAVPRRAGPSRPSGPRRRPGRPPAPTAGCSRRGPAGTRSPRRPGASPWPAWRRAGRSAWSCSARGSRPAGSPPTRSAIARRHSAVIASERALAGNAPSELPSPTGARRRSRRSPAREAGCPPHRRGRRNRRPVPGTSARTALTSRPIRAPQLGDGSRRPRSSACQAPSRRRRPPGGPVGRSARDRARAHGAARRHAHAGPAAGAACPPASRGASSSGAGPLVVLAERGGPGPRRAGAIPRRRRPPCRQWSPRCRRTGGAADPRPRPGHGRRRPRAAARRTRRCARAFGRVGERRKLGGVLLGQLAGQALGLGPRLPSAGPSGWPARRRGTRGSRRRRSAGARPGRRRATRGRWSGRPMPLGELGGQLTDDSHAAE